MRKRTGKKIRNRIEYLLLMGFTYIIWAIPLNGLYFMASVLGGFIFSVLRIRRKVVLNNLKLAFPDKTDHERLMIARKTYQHFARMTFEVIRMPRMGKDELFSLGVMKDQNVLDKALQGEKGAILLTGHFGNWELYAASLARHGYPISSLVNNTIL